MKQPTIEQLILAHGTRGIERMARYLPPNYAALAARALWNSPRVLITTGFYVEGRAETDGPPGAFFLGRALAQLGASVCYVGERYILELLGETVEALWRPAPGENRSEGFGRLDLIEFPVTDAATSRALSQEIMLNRRPSAVIAIERCGRTISGHYRNIRGTDITPWTAKVDELFPSPGGQGEIATVGVGDGGNEIGMGSLAQRIPDELGITDPVETRVGQLVLAAVSNWGAYGIIAYLSEMAGRDLLPGEAEEARAVEMMVARGAIDGLTHRAEPSVDGFPPQVTSAVIAALRGAIR